MGHDRGDCWAGSGRGVGGGWGWGVQMKVVRPNTDQLDIESLSTRRPALTRLLEKN